MPWLQGNVKEGPPETPSQPRQCIIVVASNDPDFDNNYEMAIFSDEVLVPEAAATALRVP
jgi:hypothetical protein